MEKYEEFKDIIEGVLLYEAWKVNPDLVTVEQIKESTMNSLSKIGLLLEESEYNKAISNAYDNGFIKEYQGESQYIAITMLGIEYAYKREYIKITNIYLKTVEVYDKVWTLQKSIQNTNKDIINTQSEIKESGEKYSNQLKEISSKNKEHEKDIKSIRDKIIEIMGIFVAIFTLISINVSSLGVLNGLSNIYDKLVMILTINGTITLSILIILLGIRNIIFGERVELKKHLVLFLLPFTLFLFAISILIYIHIIN